MPTRVSLIVACSKNRVIGRNGDLPWRLSNDLKNFKRLTMGHVLIMGRKTLESIGRLLPGRTTVVLTRNPDFQFDGALVAGSWNDAMRQAEKTGSKLEEVFVVGGGDIYRMVLPHADRVYLTEVLANVDGDTYFPGLPRDQWQEVRRETFPADKANEYPHAFVMLDRIGVDASHRVD